MPIQPRNRLATTPNSTPVLRKGMRNDAVRTLEKKLQERGLLEGPADRFYDAKTRAAVQKFERSKGWKTDGIAGGRLQRALGVVEGPAPQEPTSGKARDTFKTVNINIKNNPIMPQNKVVHDVKRAAQQGDLIGWNEIGPDRYFQAIKDLGPAWGHYFPRDGKLRIPNPISWKKETWEKLDGGFMKTHGGEAKVSPNRYITWVKLKHKETGKTVIRLNTHLVSGAWNSKKQPTDAWRQEKWKVHMAKLKNLVAKFEKQGHAVVVGGDFNRDSYKVLGNQVVYDNKLNVGTHGRSTLDYVMHVKDDELKALGAKVQKGYASDHDAVVVRYSLKNNKR